MNSSAKDKKNILIYLLALSLSGFSCTGVKNISGTLSKSDDKARADNSRHGDYLKTSGTARPDSIGKPGLSYQPANTVLAPATASAEPRQPDLYRRDYGRLTDIKPDASNPGSVTVSNSVQDFNQKLVNQYAEMDRVGDVLLYELDIIDRRYALLLEQFRTANSQDRENISKELDKLNGDQLALYKAYTKVYKFGKSDWIRVKAEVDATLMSLRGVDKR